MCMTHGKLEERRAILCRNKAPSLVCAQNILGILGSIINTLGRTYVINLTTVKGLRGLIWVSRDCLLVFKTESNSSDPT